MGKGSVLGKDPLNWMKINENKKLLSLENKNAVNLNHEKSSQQTSFQTTIKQQIPVSVNSSEVSDIIKTQQPVGKINDASDGVIKSKPKVVIGRLYEKPSENVKSIQSNEIAFQGPKSCTETSFFGSRTIQPKRIESEISRVPVSTYIIIAYTALMLILGYLVYHDFSKQTSRIEARLFAIEKALRLK